MNYVQRSENEVSTPQGLKDLAKLKMSKMQGALFQDDEPNLETWRIPALSGERYLIEAFDFEAQDEWSHKPGPKIIPEWLALGIDDPDWTPVTIFG